VEDRQLAEVLLSIWTPACAAGWLSLRRPASTFGRWIWSGSDWLGGVVDGVGVCGACCSVGRIRPACAQMIPGVRYGPKRALGPAPVHLADQDHPGHAPRSVMVTEAGTDGSDMEDGDPDQEEDAPVRNKTSWTPADAGSV